MRFGVLQNTETEFFPRKDARSRFPYVSRRKKQCVLRAEFIGKANSKTETIVQIGTASAAAAASILALPE
jgi:hypothetical protein